MTSACLRGAILTSLGSDAAAQASRRTTRNGNITRAQTRANALPTAMPRRLPVYAPGALPFVGDGHAAQGAGKLTGDALEISMDIEFTVNVRTGGAPPNPRVENTEYLMASGIAGSIDEAFRGATTNLVRWLETDYGLNAAEVSSVLWTSMIYDVAEVVDPQPHVVAKVPKSVLAALRKAESHS